MRYKILTLQVPLETLEKQGIWTDEISNVKEMQEQILGWFSEELALISRL